MAAAELNRKIESAPLAENNRQRGFDLLRQMHGKLMDASYVHALTDDVSFVFDTQGVWLTVFVLFQY